ncbi:MAG: tRNA-binding protein [Flavobacteriaceae bacterium]
MSDTITFDDFTKLDLRIGTIIEVNDFPKAHKPAYQLKIDFGTLGTKQSSAQIVENYSKDDLLKRQIIAVVNFKPKQIANFLSECLVLGVTDNDGAIVLLKSAKNCKNGQVVS